MPQQALPRTSPMITPETRINVGPESVEYRTPMAGQVRVIRVWTRLAEPRIMAYGEFLIDGETQQIPLSLFVSEINTILTDALIRAGKGGSLPRPS